MNGPQDMGGQAGFGSIAPEPNDGSMSHGNDAPLP
jgi:hypothetical protein